MVFQEHAEIISNKEIARGYYRMKVASPKIARGARPGQFVHIRCGEGFDPFLRRPLSILRFDREGGCLEVIYQVVGRGTGALSKSPTGGKLDILGPLGNGFPVAKTLKLVKSSLS